MADLVSLPTQEIERSAIRKIMLSLAPFLALLYVFNMLDRGNVSSAALTMQKDLHFSDTVYGLGAGIFFIGYFFFEVPSNLVMERVGARRWIARIMISWGIISACMMFVRNPASFYGLRTLLGVAEAGFFPGIILYLTYWVPSKYRAQVIARFLALTAIIGLVGPLISGQLLRMNGIGGLAGWQWLFLLEGMPSILLGFVVLGILPDRPSQAGWLTPEEKSWIESSLVEDAQNTQRVQHLSWRVALTEPRIRMLCLIFIVTSVGGNAIGFFGPQLIKSRSGGLWPDWLVVTALVIPDIVGAAAMALAAGHSDRTGRRRRHVTLGYFLAGLSFVACVFAPNAGWTIAALAFHKLGERTAAGSYWALTTNLLGVRAAAGGIALINSVGNLGGFFGPLLMGKLKDSTHGGYTVGLYTAAGFMVLGSILAYFARNHPSSNPVQSAYVEGPTAIASQTEQQVP
ncbi:MAG TPA: MFS transporter [Chthonomonadaceae bacterium]|nr:MFS transporter [Chthonomonadaceae bacterium]